MGFKVSDISFQYDAQKVIQNLSVEFESGVFYGIIGPNGCGKTTLTDMLCGHKKPISGQLTYKGKLIREYAKKELAAHIAIVPQNFYINFPFTVREIVMMGRYPHIPRFSSPGDDDLAIVEEILNKTDTLKFENRRITDLSGGERQRVVFARALAQDTDVLILDEATSNLDIRHSLGLLNLARKRVVEKGKTIIAVFQDINLAAAFCDALVFLKAGQIIAGGPAESVLTPETIKAVFDVDAKVYFDEFSHASQVVFNRKGTGF